MKRKQLFSSQRVRRGIAVGLCLGSGIFLVAHDPKDRCLAECEGLSAVFSDLTLVAKQSCTEPQYATHGITPLAQPQYFQYGVCYAYLVPSTQRESTHTLLERRLQEQGELLTHSPTANHDLIHLMSGGPLFQIEFAKGKRKGHIRAVPDPLIAADRSLRSLWKTVDIVLYLEP